VGKIFSKKIITGTVFRDLAKALDIVWVDGVFYYLTVHNFPSYFVKNILYYRHDYTFETSFETPTFTARGMSASVADSAIVFPVLFSLYIIDMRVP
jgi:hypothetical protein